MAPTNQKPADSKKRKRTTDPIAKFGKSNPKKSRFPPKSSETVRKPPKTKKEARLQSKERVEERKQKRKTHYDLERELAALWEKMRSRNISEEDRSKWVTEALNKMKGKIPEIVGSPVSSRVLQTCVKYCSEEAKKVVFEELRPHFLTLACRSQRYAVYLVKKMLDNASKKHLADFISSLHGHVASLLRHKIGSLVIEHAYKLGNPAQKRALLVELYSPELQLFRDLVSVKDSRLLEIISKLGLQKGSVSRYMSSVFQPLLKKGIVDHSIIHRALMEYFSIADQSSALEVIKQLSNPPPVRRSKKRHASDPVDDTEEQLSGPLLVRMIHTKDGSRLGILCIKHGSAKERKKIIKGLTGLVGNTVHDRFGCLLLVCILSNVDDTKLVTKVIIRELQAILKDIIMDKNGRLPLLQLLHPNCTRYFSPDDLSSLDSSIPSLCNKVEVDSELNEQQKASDGKEVEDGPNGSKSVHVLVGGKKDPFLRRQELLVKSGLAESLMDTCSELAGELLVSSIGKEVIYEVASGGADGILHSGLDDKLHILHEAIAALVAKPKSEGSEEEHLLENFHSSRTIRKLVLDCPAFASTLWENALKGNCEVWAKGHSSKVVAAFLESSDSAVREVAKEEVQPLIDSGVLRLPETKQPAEAS